VTPQPVVKGLKYKVAKLRGKASGASFRKNAVAATSGGGSFETLLSSIRTRTEPVNDIDIERRKFIEANGGAFFYVE